MQNASYLDQATQIQRCKRGVGYVNFSSSETLQGTPTVPVTFRELVAQSLERGTLTCSLGIRLSTLGKVTTTPSPLACANPYLDRST